MAQNNQINEELKNFPNMLNYITENFEKMPLMLQSQLVQMFLKFNADLKPFYLATVIATGGDITRNE